MSDEPRIQPETEPQPSGAGLGQDGSHVARGTDRR